MKAPARISGRSEVTLAPRRCPKAGSRAPISGGDRANTTRPGRRRTAESRRNRSAAPA
jgi:hypothetical protein